MNWAIKSYEEANHPLVPKLGHPAELTARPGERVELSAEGSFDPDGDSFSYHWFYYGEAGTFVTATERSGDPVPIQNVDKQQAWFTVPTSYFRTGTMHIILAVTDNGTPALTRYRSVIVNVKE